MPGQGASLRMIGQRDDWDMVVLSSPGPGRIAWIYKSLVSADGR
jgi:hypothetical protein